MSSLIWNRLQNFNISSITILLYLGRLHAILNLYDSKLFVISKLHSSSTEEITPSKCARKISSLSCITLGKCFLFISIMTMLTNTWFLPLPQIVHQLSYIHRGSYSSHHISLEMKQSSLAQKQQM